MATTTVGAISELLVSADLMARGLAVFRALSSACSCDLAVLEGEKLLRIEVKTGYINTITGTKSFAKPKPGSFDVLAVVYPTHIEYDPPWAEPAPVNPPIAADPKIFIADSVVISSARELTLEPFND